MTKGIAIQLSCPERGIRFFCGQRQEVTSDLDQAKVFKSNREAEQVASRFIGTWASVTLIPV